MLHISVVLQCPQYRPLPEAMLDKTDKWSDLEWQILCFNTVSWNDSSYIFKSALPL